MLSLYKSWLLQAWQKKTQTLCVGLCKAAEFATKKNQQQRRQKKVIRNSPAGSKL